MTPGNLLEKNELVWIFGCVSNGLGIGRSEGGRVRIPAGLDWPSLHRFLKWHRLAPLFLEGLGTHGTGLANLPWAADLRAMVAKGVRRNLWLSSALVLVCKSFQDARIPFLVLKGLPLALQAYGDLGKRLGRDIDVLIPPSYYKAAADVLERLGYLQAERPFPYATDLRFQYASGEVWCQEDVLLDLHWQFTDQGMPFDLDPGTAIGNADHVMIGDCKIPVLSAGHRFLYLVHHAAKHQWMRIFWLADLAAMIGRGDVPVGPSFRSLAASLGLRRPLAMSCFLLEELFHANIPEAMWPDSVRRDQLSSLRKAWRDFALKDLAYTHQSLLQLSNSRVLAWSLALTEGPFRKMAVAFHLGFRPSMTDIHSLALPQKLRFLYWIWRPLRLTLKTLKVKLAR